MKMKTTKMFSITPRDNHTGNTEDEYEDSDDDLFTPVLIFRCSKCSASFPTTRQLQRHRRREHLKTRTRRKMTWLAKRRKCSMQDCNDAGSEDENEEDEVGPVNGSVSGESRSVSGESQMELGSPTSSPERMNDGVAQQKIGDKIFKSLKVVVTRLAFIEIEVTRLSSGFREIRYTVEADSDSNPAKADISSSSSSNDSSSVKFYDWRVVTIKALPKKILPPPAPFVPKGNFSQQQRTAPSTFIEENSFFLKIPQDHFFKHHVDGVDADGDVHSILNIITGQTMDAFVLDAYISLLVSSYNNEINVGIRSAYKLRPISMTKFIHLSIQFLPLLSRDHHPSTLRPNLRVLPDATLLDDDTVIIAPILACNHFYLAVFNCYTKSVYVYDSYWNFVSNEWHVEHIKRLLVSIFPDCTRRWNIFFDFKCAQQGDNCSCGCYVAYFAENVLKSKSHRNARRLSVEEVSEIREKMVTELLSTTKTGRRVLQAITE